MPSAVVYQNAFEGTPDLAGWSRQSLATTPTMAMKPDGTGLGADQRGFLGEFARNQSTTLILNGLAEHTVLTVEFDLYVIRSWDGNNATCGGNASNNKAGDQWSVSLAGRADPILKTTFRNWNNDTQEFAGPDYPNGGAAARTGAVAVNQLGYTFTTGGKTYQLDAVYHFSLPVVHSGPTAELTFAGHGLQGLADESWGLDNVRVSTSTVPVAASWDDWRQVTVEEDPNDGYSKPETPGWTSDGDVRRTPAGNASLREEGPYLRTVKDDWTSFKMTLEYRTKDTTPVPPWPAGEDNPRPGTNEHYGNSGVYIFNRYEVQIIDPSQFDLPGGNKGVPPGGDIAEDWRDEGNNKAVAPGTAGAKRKSETSQLTPGGLYKVTPQAGTTYNHKNHAKKTGEWNTLTIEFRPPTFDADAPTDPTEATAATIKTWLNGKLVYDGPINDVLGKPAKGTGSRGGDPVNKPMDYAEISYVKQGAIYLQSHWGSQVEFRNVETVSVS